MTMPNPIYHQIDPIRLAEVDRSLKIAQQYGDRLKKGGNLKSEAVENLLVKYPSHGFVIDRKEAGTLFDKVEKPTPELMEVKELFAPIARITVNADDETFAYFVSSEPPAPAAPEPPAPEQPQEVPNG